MKQTYDNYFRNYYKKHKKQMYASNIKHRRSCLKCTENHNNQSKKQLKNKYAFS